MNPRTPRWSPWRLSIPVLAATLLSLAGCETPEPDTGEAPALTTSGEAEAGSHGKKSNLIQIGLSGGQPTVDKDSACASVGRWVMWAADDDTIASWKVQMVDDPGPLTTRTINSAQDPSKPEGAKVARGSNDQSFAYTVQVTTTAGDTFGSDPDIVIKDPGTLLAQGKKCRK